MIGQRLPGTLERPVDPDHDAARDAGRGAAGFPPGSRERASSDLRRKMARFAADNAAALGDAEPEHAVRRVQPFRRQLAPAAGDRGRRRRGLAGGAPGTRCGSTSARPRMTSSGTQLLEDVRVVFDQYVDADGRTKPAQKLASTIIVGALKEMDDRPWNEMGRSGAPITQHKLGRMLKQFQISSHGSIRLASGKTSKGYRRIDFEEAWNRYLPPDVPIQSGTTAQPKETAASGGFRTVTNGPDVPDRKTPKAAETADCAAVPVEKRGSGAKREKRTVPSPPDRAARRPACRS